MTYSTEYEDDDGKTFVRDFGADREAARRHARSLSRRDHYLIVYVVADKDGDRVGAEGYAHGRLDSVDGQMAA